MTNHPPHPHHLPLLHPLRHLLMNLEWTVKSMNNHFKPTFTYTVSIQCSLCYWFCSLFFFDELEEEVKTLEREIGIVQKKLKH